MRNPELGEGDVKVAGSGAWFAAAMAAVSLAGVTGCTKSSSPSSAGASGLTVSASKSSYKSGEPIVLQVKLSNTAKSSCRVAGIPDGVLTVAAAARDGSPLTPTLSGGDYVNGFAAVIAANTVVVDPGKSVTVPLEANTAQQEVLPSLTLGTGDRSVDALYAVGQPGKYEISVIYRMPPIELPAPPACAIGADAVSVSFTVAGG